MKTVSIDKGHVPTSLQQQQDRREKLLQTGGSPVANVEESAPIVAPVPTVLEIYPPNRTAHRASSETVEIHYVPSEKDTPRFRLSFQVSDVCIKPCYISMLIVSDMGFQPANLMKFDLSYRDEIYPVIFAGAEFEFPSLGIRGISFLVDRNRKPEESNLRTQH